MKTVAVLVIIVLSGCSHVVQRQISVYPKIESRPSPIVRERASTLKVDGFYLQRAVLKFMIDDSGVVYVNGLVKAAGVESVNAIRLLDFRFDTRTEVMSVPLGRTTWIAFLSLEFERLPDGMRYTCKTQIEVDVPPAHTFLGPATTERGIDDEMLGKLMAQFVGAKFQAASVALVEQLKRPNQSPLPTSGLRPAAADL